MDTLAQTCPHSDCGRPFSVPATRHGRRIFCPGCGRALVAMDPATIRRREAEALRRRIAMRDPRAATAALDGAGTQESAGRDPDFIALLENIRSLWNVGSMFRTADGAGLGRLILTGITGRPPRAEITKTALGAEAIVPWEYVADPEEAVAHLKAAGFRILALENDPRAVPLPQATAAGRLCLVLGHEVAGISPALLAAADQMIALPMRGAKSSLNVAVAFGVAAYALAATREESPGPIPNPPPPTPNR
jgi:tRNA G18 (ribose-2'-O)-methylase SpoU